MSPIFSHFTITQEHISDHMMDYVRERQTHVYSQKSLVGVMKAICILLLKWYILEGLVMR